MSVKALLDANVLYGATTRSVLLYLAIGGVFRPRWSDAIQDEWTAALLRERPDIEASRIARTRDLMERHFPEATVAGYEPLIATLDLPDPDDRHVLAAAIQAGASVIVTANLADFPADVLASHDIRVEGPDQFVSGMLDADAPSVVSALALDRANLRNPPMTGTEYLTALERAGLTGTAAALRRLGVEL